MTARPSAIWTRSCDRSPRAPAPRSDLDARPIVRMAGPQRYSTPRPARLAHDLVGWQDGNHSGADQLLLLGVDREHWSALRLMLSDLLVQVGELGVSIRVRRFLFKPSLDGGLDE